MTPAPLLTKIKSIRHAQSFIHYIAHRDLRMPWSANSCAYQPIAVGNRSHRCQKARVYQSFRVQHSTDLTDITPLSTGSEVGHLIIYNKFPSLIKYDNDFFKNLPSKHSSGVNCIRGLRTNISPKSYIISTPQNQTKAVQAIPRNNISLNLLLVFYFPI